MASYTTIIIASLCVLRSLIDAKSIGPQRYKFHPRMIDQLNKGSSNHNQDANHQPTLSGTPSQSFESGAKSLESQVISCFKEFKERQKIQTCILIAAVQRVKANQGQSYHNKNKGTFPHRNQGSLNKNRNQGPSSNIQGSVNEGSLSNQGLDNKKETLSERPSNSASR